MADVSYALFAGSAHASARTTHQGGLYADYPTMSARVAANGRTGETTRLQRVPRRGERMMGFEPTTFCMANG